MLLRVDVLYESREGRPHRIQAQKQLNELHISPQDLQQPELLSKAAAALGAAAVLVGAATFSPKDAALILSLRKAASGKEVHSTDYHEKLEPAFDSSFPAVEDANSHFYHFLGWTESRSQNANTVPTPTSRTKRAAREFREAF